MIKLYKHCYGAFFTTLISLATFWFIRLISNDNNIIVPSCCLLIGFSIFIIFRKIHIGLLVGIILGIGLSFWVHQKEIKKFVYPGQDTKISSFTGIILGDSSIYHNQHTVPIKLLESHTQQTTTSAQGILSLIIAPNQDSFFRGMIIKVFFHKQKFEPTTKYLYITQIETNNNFSNIFWKMRAKFLFKSRKFLLNRFGNSADLIFALVFGDRSFLTALQTDHIQKSGLSHLLALSGLHIYIFIWIFSKLASLLKIKKSTTKWIILILLPCCIFIVGSPYSLIRAYILFLLVFLLRKLHHNARVLDILGFSCLISLIFEPLSILSASWQLSFLSVFGILVFKEFYNVKLGYLPQVIRGGLSISLAVMTTVTPCLIKYFGRTYPQGIVGTIIILPMLFIWMLLGFISALIPYSLLLFEYYNHFLWTLIKLFSWIPSLNSVSSLIIWSILVPTIFHIDLRKLLAHAIFHINLRRCHIREQQPNQLQFQKIHTQFHAKS